MSYDRVKYCAVEGQIKRGGMGMYAKNAKIKLHRIDVFPGFTNTLGCRESCVMISWTQNRNC